MTEKTGTKSDQELRTSGLSWWFRGQESACQCGKHGSIPGPGRSHVPERLTLSLLKSWPK